MKGIILAGGTGTRLLPLTAVTSKQLLPVYDRPMIFYPLNTLIQAGIKDILIIVAPDHSGHFLNLLGSMFQKFGVNISFMVQKQPRGLAEAYVLAEDFIDGEATTLILGDNIFENDFSEAIQTFQGGGRIFAKEVSDPERFGVVELGTDREVLSIEEKPEQPKSRLAIVGIYIFDAAVVEAAKGLTPSARGELEITDLQKHYLDQGKLDVRTVEGAWFDTGTYESLFEASAYAREHRFSERFHPMVNDALGEFNAEFKKIVSLKK
ncbi:MAG: spore coat protein [Candidatus Moranbacteria bacterium RIFCSPHIGHO2_12_FULL_54_9]|nr:MAG: spore coat protein [Candidatus Moranbacteria bacterium RIFCSPHIGHO2_01_FULL_54_31]OGI25688.1 MAG: spore coat protein [Candidatus Moranbacteria bacterium RIFCSPHIGHO2_12_FULL_54_9]